MKEGARRSMRSSRIAAASVLALSLLAPLRAAAPPEPRPALLIVLDASGSMRAKLGATTRIGAARAGLRALVSDLPEDSLVGLRVYGHRFAGERARGCRDTQLVVPVRTLDRRRLRSKIGSFQPRGFTPIGRSLAQAGRDLPPRSERNIVLVSDGISTCMPPPCEVAGRLDRRDIRVDVIGLSIRGSARRQMQCIARAGGGRYYDARSADQLADRLQRLALEAFRTYEVKGTKVRGAQNPAEAPMLEPGDYSDTLGRASDRWYAVMLERNQSVSVSSSVVGDPRGDSSRFARVALRLYTPDLSSPLSARGVTDFGGTAPVTASAQSEPVGEPSSAADWRRPGVYYLRLSLLDADELRNSAYPVELRLAVEGQPPSPAPPEEESSAWMLVAVAWLVAGLVSGAAIVSAVRRIIAR